MSGGIHRHLVLLLAWGTVSIISIVVDRWPSPELRFAPLLLGALLVARRSRRRWVGSAAAVLGFGVVSTLVLVVAVPEVVGARADLRAVAFGWPSPWLVQDLSQLDPPAFPRSVGPLAHAELGTPVEVRWLAFGASLAAVTAGASSAGWALRHARHRLDAAHRRFRVPLRAEGARGGPRGDGVVR